MLEVKLCFLPVIYAAESNFIVMQNFKKPLLQFQYPVASLKPPRQAPTLVANKKIIIITTILLGKQTCLMIGISSQVRHEQIST